MNLRQGHVSVKENKAVQIVDVLTSSCVNHDKFAVVAILCFFHWLPHQHGPYPYENHERYLGQVAVDAVCLDTVPMLTL